MAFTLTKTGNNIMELDSIMMVLDKLWLALAAWYWYDKQQMDKRMKEMEKSAADSEKMDVFITSELKSLSLLMELRLNTLKEDIDEIKVAVRTNVNKGN